MSKYKVWHIPQVPMNPFEVFTDDLKQAVLIMDILAEYDDFQHGFIVFQNNFWKRYTWSDSGQRYFYQRDVPPDAAMRNYKPAN